MGFAPLAGRNTSQILPLSEAHAISAVFRPFPRSTTDPEAAPLAGVLRTSAFAISCVIAGCVPVGPWTLSTA